MLLSYVSQGATHLGLRFVRYDVVLFGYLVTLLVTAESRNKCREQDERGKWRNGIRLHWRGNFQCVHYRPHPLLYGRYN